MRGKSGQWTACMCRSMASSAQVNLSAHSIDACCPISCSFLRLSAQLASTFLWFCCSLSWTLFFLWPLCSCEKWSRPKISMHTQFKSIVNNKGFKSVCSRNILVFEENERESIVQLSWQWAMKATAVVGNWYYWIKWPFPLFGWDECALFKSVQ